MQGRDIGVCFGPLWSLSAAFAVFAATVVPIQAQDLSRPINTRSMPVGAFVEPGPDASTLPEPEVQDAGMQGDSRMQGNLGMQGTGIPDSAMHETGMIVDVESHSLTLQSLEAQALRSNPSIDRAAALVHAARGRALQVGLRPNPDFGFDFQQLGSDGLAEQYGAVIGQEFVRREKLELSRSAALHEVQRLEQQLVAQRQRVLTDVRIAFIRALRAERQMELTQQLVQIGERGVAVAKELFNAQEVGRGDVLQAELEVESASILLRNAENRKLAVWRELSAVTGQPLLSPQPLEGDIVDEEGDMQFVEALARLQNQSPEIAAVMAEIHRARCNLQRQQVEPRPNVDGRGADQLARQRRRW